MSKIGFVGVGRMGSNMARHLKEKGYKIGAVYDVRTESATHWDLSRSGRPNVSPRFRRFRRRDYGRYR